MPMLSAHELIDKLEKIAADRPPPESEPFSRVSTALGPQWDAHDAFTVEEAAKILRLSRGAAFAAVGRKEIPSLRIGKRLIIPRLALVRYLAGAGAP